MDLWGPYKLGLLHPRQTHLAVFQQGSKRHELPPSYPPSDAAWTRNSWSLGWENGGIFLDPESCERTSATSDKKMEVVWVPMTFVVSSRFPGD